MAATAQFTLKASQDAVLVTLRPSSFSVAINVSTIYNFDGEGRMLGAYVDGRNYLRGLDNRVLVKWGAGHGLARRSRHDLSETEKHNFFAQAVAALAGIAEAVQRRNVQVMPGSDDSLLDAVAVALLSVRDGVALKGDAERFRSIYTPVAILPPDQYLAAVVQATEGCSWNRCTFCDFYRQQPFRIKGDDEFRRHVSSVVAFFGRAIGLRRSLFLADANALVIPQDRLLRLLDILEEELPVVPGELEGDERAAWRAAHPGALGGMYSFVDAFSIRHKSRTDYRTLAQRGLRRVYIGLESGDDRLLAVLSKQNSAAEVREGVDIIRSGGVDVGVIVMLGIGGWRFAADHVRHTTAVLNAMALGSRDMIYFSPFMDFEGSAYGRLAEEMGVEPLTRV